MEGMSEQESEFQDHVLVDTLTNKLFALPEDSFEFGTDLYALNIQRGRDHGLPPYNYWRKVCGLSVFNSMSEMSGYLRSSGIDALRDAYGYFIKKFSKT